MHKAGDAGCVRDYVYVGDVVKANIAACEGSVLEGKVPPLLNVSTGVPTSTRVLAEAVRALTGDAAPFKTAAPRAGDVKRSVLDAGDLVRVLGPATTL